MNTGVFHAYFKFKNYHFCAEWAQKLYAQIIS